MTTKPRYAGSAADSPYAAFYRTESHALMRLGFVLTGSNETAEDIVQEVFIRCAPRLDGLDDPARYLRAAVVNACRSHHPACGSGPGRLGAIFGGHHPRPHRKPLQPEYRHLARASRAALVALG